MLGAKRRHRMLHEVVLSHKSPLIGLGLHEADKILVEDYHAAIVVVANSTNIHVLGHRAPRKSKRRSSSGNSVTDSLSNQYYASPSAGTRVVVKATGRDRIRASNSQDTSDPSNFKRPIRPGDLMLLVQQTLCLAYLLYSNFSWCFVTLCGGARQSFSSSLLKCHTFVFAKTGDVLELLRIVQE